mmetsp:Transcript_14530/g.30046  ORF Transcript_14530/g.30046 Transcript_14530/m.30046 type:complete len:342 (+) Transcript_14530:1215-2240(+)
MFVGMGKRISVSVEVMPAFTAAAAMFAFLFCVLDIHIFVGIRVGAGGLKSGHQSRIVTGLAAAAAIVVLVERFEQNILLAGRPQRNNRFGMGQRHAIIVQLHFFWFFFLLLFLAFQAHNLVGVGKGLSVSIQTIFVVVVVIVITAVDAAVVVVAVFFLDVVPRASRHESIGVGQGIAPALEDFHVCITFGIRGLKSFLGGSWPDFVAKAREETSLGIFIVVHKIVGGFFFFLGSSVVGGHEKIIIVVVIIEKVLHLWILRFLAGLLGDDGTTAEKIPIGVGIHWNQDRGIRCSVWRRQEIEDIVIVIAWSTALRGKRIELTAIVRGSGCGTNRGRKARGLL